MRYRMTMRAWVNVIEIFGIALVMALSPSLCAAQSRIASSVPAAAAESLVTVNAAHSSAVGKVAFSPDGAWMVSGGSDQSIKIWETRSGRLLRTLTATKESIRHIVVTPDGKRIVTASWDKKIRVWEAETGRLQHVLVSPGADYLHDNFFVVTRAGVLITQYMHGIRRWDIASGKLLATIPTRKPTEMDYVSIQSIALSRDEKWIAVGYQKNFKTTRISLWDAATGRSIREFEGHTRQITSVAFSPDGALIASSSEDRTVRLWNSATGQLLRTLAGHEKDVRSVAFSPDGRLLISGGYDNTVRIWNVASGQPVRTIEGAKYQTVWTVAISPDGKSVVSAGGPIPILWDIESGAQLQSFPNTGPSHVVYVNRAPDQKLLITGALGLETWDPATGQLVDRQAYEKDLSAPAAAAARHLPGPWHFLRYTSKPNTLATWDAESGRVVTTFAMSEDPAIRVYNTALSADGRRVAAGIQRDPINHSAMIRIWDSAGTLLQEIPEPAKYGVFKLEFSPDARLLAWLSGDGPVVPLKIWDMASGRLVRTIQDPNCGAHDIRFSPDGRALLAFGGCGDPTAGNIRLYETSSGRLLWRGNTEQTVAGGFSPDGRLLVFASRWSSRVTVLNASNGETVRSLSGNPGLGLSATFSQDGARIIIGNENGTTALWNTETGDLLTITVHAQSGEWLTMTPEGFFAASDNGAKLVHVVQGFNTTSIDQLYQSLYRPDLVRQKLAGDPRGLVREAAARLDLTRALASGDAPVVRMIAPANGASVPNNVTATVDIAEQGGGIGRVEWRVNGLTLGIDSSPQPTGPGQPVRLSRNLALDAGDSTIEIIAYNGANLVASEPVRIAVAVQVAPPSPQPEPSTTIPSPRLFVLAAGTDDYADERLRLQYSVQDARAMAQAMVDAGKGFYNNVETRVMSDAEVDAGKLDAVFEDLSKLVQPTDVFVLYLAGHGKTVDGRYYYVPRTLRIDGDMTDSKIANAVRTQGISQEQWQRWFALIAARKSLILFDTCESGTLTSDESETKTLERGAASDRLAQATGRSIITASSGSTEAFEGYRGHGLFTYNLLDALDRGDGDGSGTIEVAELATYVYSQVVALSEQVFKQRQEPQIKINTNYALSRQTRVLRDAAPAVAETKPTYELTQTAQLQMKPNGGAKAVRSLSAKTEVTVLKSEGGWSLVASGGRPLGYVATRDLARVP